jgi:hypothetical protein
MSSKLEWLWPIVTSAVVGGGLSFSVTQFKSDDSHRRIEALEERERGYIGTMGRLAQSQEDLARSQERLALAMEDMNDKLDDALRRPRRP